MENFARLRGRADRRRKLRHGDQRAGRQAPALRDDQQVQVRTTAAVGAVGRAGPLVVIAGAALRAATFIARRAINARDREVGDETEREKEPAHDLGYTTLPAGEQRPGFVGPIPLAGRAERMGQ